MTVFVDTSALYALLDRTDQNYIRAAKEFGALVARKEDLVCTNYILVETVSLLQRRIGFRAVGDFLDAIVLILRLIWVEQSDHNASINALRLANKRQLSLVDCVSFTMMRRSSIKTVFTFDAHFAEQGFECIPAP